MAERFNQGARRHMAESFSAMGVGMAVLGAIVYACMQYTHTSPCTLRARCVLLHTLGIHVPSMSSPLWAADGGGGAAAEAACPSCLQAACLPAPPGLLASSRPMASCESARGRAAGAGVEHPSDTAAALCCVYVRRAESRAQRAKDGQES